MKTDNHYPGFDYPAKELYKFIKANDLFTIMLNDGRIVHFTADDADSFRQWLLANKIQDIERIEDTLK